MSLARAGFLAVVLLSAAIAVAAAPAGTAAETAQQTERLENGDRVLQAEDGWLTYFNDRHGMRLSYPAELFSSREPAPSGHGFRFLGENARIEVSAWENETAVTPEEMAADLLQTEGYGTVEHQEIGDDRMVLAGRRADQAFYEEYAFVGTSVQAFGLEYPAAQRDTYEPLLEEMAASFRPGNGFATGAVAEVPQQPPSVPSAADPEEQPISTMPERPRAGTAAGVHARGSDIAGQERRLLHDGKKKNKRAAIAGPGARKHGFVPPGWKKQKAKPARGKKQKGKRGRGKKR